MSWNGTVRCQHCYGQGHNQRGCPKLKEQMEQRLANDPDDWRAKRYFEKKKGAKVRRCTYCNLKGHNRATCPELKIKVAAWKKKNSSWRKAIVEELLAAGMGVGALIKHADLPWRMDHKKQLVMTAGINPDAHINEVYHGMRVQGIMNPTQVGAVKFPQGILDKVAEKVDGNDPVGLRHGLDTWYGSSVTVMSETKNCLLRSIPNHEEWLKAGDPKWIKKEIFGNSQSEKFYENRYVE